MNIKSLTLTGFLLLGLCACGKGGDSSEPPAKQKFVLDYLRDMPVELLKSGQEESKCADMFRDLQKQVQAGKKYPVEEVLQHEPGDGHHATLRRIVDPSNGYVAIRLERDHGPCSFEMAVFRDSKNVGLVAISYVKVGNSGVVRQMSRWGQFKMYRVSEKNEWNDVTVEVLPAIRYQDFMVSNFDSSSLKDLTPIQMKLLTVLYKIPHKGTKLKAIISTHGAIFACPLSDEEAAACRALGRFQENLQFGEIHLAWDKEKASFITATKVAWKKGEEHLIWMAHDYPAYDGHEPLVW